MRGSVFRRWNFKFQRAGRAGRNLVFLENNHSVSVLVDIEALILRNAGEASHFTGEKVFGILVNGGVYHRVGSFLPVRAEHVGQRERFAGDQIDVVVSNNDGM